jgi:hypothetical protein
MKIYKFYVRQNEYYIDHIFFTELHTLHTLQTLTTISTVNIVVKKTSRYPRVIFRGDLELRGSSAAKLLVI